MSKTIKNNATESTKNVQTLIIGFGFSSIPLIRELENSGEDFLVLNGGKTVWERLADANRLDFDLVSSQFTSYYSFDLVEQIKQGLKEDFYPTAREYYNKILEYKDQFNKNVIDGNVVKIENHEDHSLVFTESGEIYKAKHVVVSTGFRRKIMKDIFEFDTNIKNKTVVFNTIGDTANMMIAKLVPNNNRVIVLHNGFLLADKIYLYKKGQYLVLDQIEMHTAGFYFKKSYADVITTSVVNLIKPAAVAVKNKFKKWLLICVIAIIDLFAKLGASLSLYVKNKQLQRARTFDRFTKLPLLASGGVAIKYWPINTYHDRFSSQSETAIRNGYLLNDLAFFIDEGHVIPVTKNEAQLDKKNKTISFNGQSEAYDFLIESSPEVPALPDIEIVKGSSQKPYKHLTRNTYFSVIPKELRNIYFMGQARPFTGGLASMTEMQALFIHKIIINPAFHDDIYARLDTLISDFSEQFYSIIAPQKTDHIFHYGFYTEALARILGINLNLRDCRSLKDLIFYFIFPNNAFKYRLKGEYRVEGVDTIIDSSYRSNNDFSVIMTFTICYYLYRFLFCEVILVLSLTTSLSVGWFFASLIIQFLFSKVFLLPVQNYYSKFKVFYLLIFAVTMPFIPTVWIGGYIMFDVIITFVMRQIGVPGSHYIFNDLKHKHKFRPFYKEYVNAFQRVYGATNK